MFAIAYSLGAVLTLTVPEGGAAWLYLLVSCAACGGALARIGRKRARE